MPTSFSSSLSVAGSLLLALAEIAGLAAFSAAIALAAVAVGSLG